MEYNKISVIVHKIGDYLKSQGVNITIGENVHQTLRAYVERPDMDAYTIHDVARAIAVITWCSAGKVIYQSLQWAQVRDT